MRPDELTGRKRLNAIACLTEVAEERAWDLWHAEDGQPQVLVGSQGLQRAGYDGLGWSGAGHRIQGYPHGLLPLDFHLHHFDIPIVAALGAHAMGQDRLIAVTAVLYLDRLHMEVTSPHALPRMGNTSLRYGHETTFTHWDK
jgi:hypothetical protein